MVKNNHQSKNLSPKRVISFRDLLGIGTGITAMLPILVAAIVTVYWLIYDFIVYKDERVFFLLMNLRISAVLLTPFLVSAIVTGFFIKKQKIIIGLVIGTLIVVVPYLLWSLNYYRSIVECVKTEPMCGEWAPLVSVFVLLICLGNFFALIGFTVLFTRVRKIQKSKAQYES